MPRDLETKGTNTMQFATSKRMTALASLGQILRQTTLRAIYRPVRFVLNRASNRRFVQSIIRQQPWLVAERREECERLRHEHELRLQNERNLLRHQIEVCLRDASSLSALENAVYNQGERLVPGRTHAESETIRHKSSYRLFRQVIESDLQRGKTSLPISILDIGCGSGHGTYDLSQISGAQVTGIDVSPESLEYAGAYYNADNIRYERIGDIFAYAKAMKSFDYIVSRHVFEHIPDAFRLVEALQWKKRLMINVPFAEKPGNPFHLWLDIREDRFPRVGEREFFYEDLAGTSYLSAPEGVFINSICCCYAHDRPDIAAESGIAFPVRPWRPEGEYAVLQENHNKLVRSLESLDVFQG
jgi:SAM-dependent methyltransferase